MSQRPATRATAIDGHPIEYRIERRGGAAVLILHGGHMSARCRFGEETFLASGQSLLCLPPDMAEHLGAGLGRVRHPRPVAAGLAEQVCCVALVGAEPPDQGCLPPSSCQC